MNLIWRFYVDPNHRWRWQCLKFDRTVATESANGYQEYEQCVADAKRKGYVYLPSQVSTRVQPRSARSR